ncbi:unnamed protein product [Prunus armeniaca]
MENVCENESEDEIEREDEMGGGKNDVSRIGRFGSTKSIKHLSRTAISHATVLSSRTTFPISTAASLEHLRLKGQGQGKCKPIIFLFIADVIDTVKKPKQQPKQDLLRACPGLWSPPAIRSCFCALETIVGPKPPPAQAKEERWKCPWYNHSSQDTKDYCQ